MQQSICKDTIFSLKHTLNCRGKLLNLSEPKVMGILNLTKDSFYDGGNYRTEKQVLERVEIILKEGADIIDIGAVSTRPGAILLPIGEEINTLMPSLKTIRKNFPEAILSIDTCWSDVAKAVAEEGADIINDISGGQYDTQMFDTIRKIQLPYILMHTQGIPQEMQKSPTYKNVVEELILFFSKQIEELRKRGVQDIILDPGFGFGKTMDHNYELMNHLHEFSLFNLPVLVGISRKSMIYKALECTPEKALAGTISLNTIALIKGAKILRVHDVKEAKDCIRMISLIQRNS